MKNIIDIGSIGWQTDDYVDSYLDGHIHQHKVKVATYVPLRDPEHSPTGASSELQYIGAYEYAPGGWISDHIHSDAEQWYYILNGRAVMRVGDEEREVGVGALIFIPKGTIHSYRVVGDEPMRILNVAAWWTGVPSVTSLAPMSEQRVLRE